MHDGDEAVNERQMEIERLSGLYQQRGIDAMIVQTADDVMKLRAENEKLRSVVDAIFAAHDDVRDASKDNLLRYKAASSDLFVEIAKQRKILSASQKEANDANG